MGIADFATGFQGAIQQQLAQRIAEQQYADKLKQQAFENQLKTGAAARAQQGLDQTAQDRQDRLTESNAAHEATTQEKANAQAEHIANTLAPGTMLGGNDPAVGRLRTAGYGSLLNPKGFPADAPPSAIANDAPDTDLPGTIANSPTPGGRLYTKTASEKQLQDAKKPDTPKERLVQVGPKGIYTRESDAEGQPGYHPPPGTITVQTVDDNGNAITKIVPKTAGAEYAKPQTNKPLPYQAVESLSGLNTAEVEGVKVLKALKESGLDQSNDPADPRWTKFVVTTLKVSPNDFGKADMQQRTAFINAALTRGLMGGRPSQYVAEMIQQHLPQGEMSGKQLAHVLHNVMQETHERRHEVANLTGKSLKDVSPVSGESYADYMAGLAGGGAGGGTVQMKAPDGRMLSVPQEKVGEMEHLGAVKVQ